MLCLTRDEKLLRVINDDGGIGDEVGLDGLGKVQQWMQEHSSNC